MIRYLQRRRSAPTCSLISLSWQRMSYEEKCIVNRLMRDQPSPKKRAGIIYGLNSRFNTEVTLPKDLPAFEAMLLELDDRDFGSVDDFELRPQTTQAENQAASSVPPPTCESPGVLRLLRGLGVSLLGLVAYRLLANA